MTFSILMVVYVIIFLSTTIIYISQRKELYDFGDKMTEIVMYKDIECQKLSHLSHIHANLEYLRKSRDVMFGVLVVTNIIAVIIFAVLF